jgi:hypothetical protein
MRASRAPTFIAEAHRQSCLVASDPQERTDQDWIDAVSTESKADE